MSNIHVSRTHPVAWDNPVVLRALAALPGAGAWVATVEQNCAGADQVTLSFTYTQGAAGGAFDFQIQVSLYSVAANVPASAGEWTTMSLYDPGLLAAGADAQSRVQREYITYQATAGGAETFIYGPIDLGAAERIRIMARESGVIAPPGTLQITGEFL